MKKKDRRLYGALLALLGAVGMILSLLNPSVFASFGENINLIIISSVLLFLIGIYMYKSKKRK